MTDDVLFFQLFQRYEAAVSDITRRELATRIRKFLDESDNLTPPELAAARHELAEREILRETALRTDLERQIDAMSIELARSGGDPAFVRRLNARLQSVKKTLAEHLGNHYKPAAARWAKAQRDIR